MAKADPERQARESPRSSADADIADHSGADLGPKLPNGSGIYLFVIVPPKQSSVRRENLTRWHKPTEVIIGPTLLGDHISEDAPYLHHHECVLLTILSDESEFFIPLSALFQYDVPPPYEADVLPRIR